MPLPPPGVWVAHSVQVVLAEIVRNSAEARKAENALKEKSSVLQIL